MTDNKMTDNNFQFCNVSDLITSILSVIILIITQLLDYIIDTIISIIYITSLKSISSSFLKSIISIYNSCILVIINSIDAIIIFVNKLRVMMMIDNNDNNDHLRSLANDADIVIESHNVTTVDGYILGLHRCSNANISSQTTKKPVVLLFHGLLQSSESLIIGGKLSLASVLVHNGYDVWIANTRGNKYSNKHVNLNEHDRKYWDFCLDDYANTDVPALITYVRNYTSVDKMSIVGFSQGSCQVFASLSIHPSLNSMVNVFIALAPPIKPVGLSDNMLSKLISVYPNITNVILGYKSCFPYMPTIQKILGLHMYTTICTLAMEYLFNWNCSCISKERRPQLFKSIFSPSSVKGIKHWFQMVKAQELNLYQDNANNEIYNNNVEELPTKQNSPYLNILKEQHQRKKSLYDLSIIECKVAVIAGADDKLIDPYIVQKKIKNCLITHVIKDYEHLDLIWADDANILVFPKILTLLEEKEKIF